VGSICHPTGAFGEDISGMTQGGKHWGWQFGIARVLAMSGAITLTECFALALSGNRVLAQIIPDSTLGAERNGGDLTLETGNLSVLNGGEVSTGVFPESSGQGGNLSVNASNSVELNGGGLVTATLGTGRAGDLTYGSRGFAA
jgi:hypothetical protein